MDKPVTGFSFTPAELESAERGRERDAEACKAIESLYDATRHAMRVLTPKEVLETFREAIFDNHHKTYQWAKELIDVVRART